MTVVWTTATGHTATSYPREFTAPGEWDRAAPGDNAGPSGGEGIGGDQGRGGAVRIEAVDVPGAPGEQVIIGPVVAGPTIPVVPAGTDYQEPHTDLEDPVTVPHPGSVEINTYRALREDTRRHALRRPPADHCDPHPGTDNSPNAAEQQLDREGNGEGNQDAEAHLHRDNDREPTINADPDAIPADSDSSVGCVGCDTPLGAEAIAGLTADGRRELDRRFRAALGWTRTPLDTGPPGPGAALPLDLASVAEPLPDEPPF